MPVEGGNELIAKLRRLKQEAGEDVSVVVGYTAPYGLYVHENLESRHAPGKQAKFLEEPARTMRPELATIVTQVYRRTKNMLQALLVAGLRLQRASQKIVPIDTGALKNSAFTRKAD